MCMAHLIDQNIRPLDNMVEAFGTMSNPDPFILTERGINNIKGRVTFGGAVFGSRTLTHLTNGIENQNETAVNMYLTRISEVNGHRLFVFELTC
jgi:hypothetical protein